MHIDKVMTELELGLIEETVPPAAIEATATLQKINVGELYSPTGEFIFDEGVSVPAAVPFTGALFIPVKPKLSRGYRIRYSFLVLVAAVVVIVDAALLVSVLTR
jgi:hypothetical protein